MKLPNRFVMLLFIVICADFASYAALAKIISMFSMHLTVLYTLWVIVSAFWGRYLLQKNIPDYIPVRYKLKQKQLPSPAEFKPVVAHYRTVTFMLPGPVSDIAALLLKHNKVRQYFAQKIYVYYHMRFEPHVVDEQFEQISHAALNSKNMEQDADSGSS